MSRIPKFAAVDLTDCDREPIHVPGSIQPDGILIAFDPETLKSWRRRLGRPQRFGLKPSSVRHSMCPGPISRSK